MRAEFLKAADFGDPENWIFRDEKWRSEWKAESEECVRETGTMVPDKTIIFYNRYIDADYAYIYAVTEDDHMVGMLFYGPNDSGLTEGLAVEVHPDYRRNGIATEMYKLAEELTEESIQPSPTHSEDAKALWAQPNRPFGKEASEDALTFTDERISADESSFDGTSSPGVRIEAHSNHQLVGAIEIFFDNNNAYVRGITVEKQYRGIGIGQQLYDQAITFAKQEGCENFYSDTANAMSVDAQRAWDRIKKRYPVEFESGEDGYDSTGRKKIPLKTASAAIDVIAYHRTNAEFDEFRLDPATGLIWFCSDPEWGSSWGSRLIKARIKITNPEVYTDSGLHLAQFDDAEGAAELKAEGFDGIVVLNPSEPDLPTNYAVVSPSQIEILPEEKKIAAAMPTLSFKKLFHVGEMDISDKSPDSLEGDGLSVSTHPEAWEEINAGYTSGPTWALTKEGNRFLNFHKLSKPQRKIIADWGIQQGLAVNSTVYRVYRLDEEGEEQWFEYNTLPEAQDEASEDDEARIEEVPGAVVGTPSLYTRMKNQPSSSMTSEWLAVCYAEDILHLDGVWWADKLDVHNYSAPRGVIFNAMLPSWDKVQVSDGSSVSEYTGKLGSSKTASGPLKVTAYHGSGEKFDSFNDEGRTLHFSDSPAVAKSYAQGYLGTGSGYLYTVELTMRKPVDIRIPGESERIAEETGYWIDQDTILEPTEMDEIDLSSEGYDGIIAYSEVGGGMKDGSTEYIVWNADLVKIRRVEALRGKKASPDYAYSQYNDRELDLANVTFDVKETDHDEAYGCIEFVVTGTYEGKEVSRVSVDLDMSAKNKHTFIIRDSRVSPEWKGTGIGQLTYDRAITKAKALKGVRLYSDVTLTDQGDAAWQRLKKRYPVKSISNGAMSTEDDAKPSSPRPQHYVDLRGKKADFVPKLNQNVDVEVEGEKRSGLDVPSINWNIGDSSRWNEDIIVLDSIPFSSIKPWQKYRDNKIVNEYVAKMKAGEPIDVMWVTPDHEPNTYSIAAGTFGGHHRYDALKKLGYTDQPIPVYIEEQTKRKQWKTAAGHPNILYHSASPENRGDILEHGLDGKMGYSYDEGNGPESVFFDSRFSQGDGGMDIWEVDATGLPIEQDETTDIEGLPEWEGSTWWVLWGSVSPERLTLKRPASKTASPDFGYSQFNDRDQDIAQLKWRIVKATDSFSIYAEENSNTRAGEVRACRFDPDAETDKGDEGIDFSIWTTSIQQPWRGTGLGQLLYEKAMQVAKEMGAFALWSDGSRSTDADKAWERLGKRFRVRFNKEQGRFLVPVNELKTAAWTGDAHNLPAAKAITETPAFKSWFAGSKVVDAQGNPEIVYHGTLDDFDEFKISDLGFHVGTVEQAESRISTKQVTTPPEKLTRYGHVMPLYACIKNPLKMPDLSEWDDIWELHGALNQATGGKFSDLVIPINQALWGADSMEGGEPNGKRGGDVAAMHLIRERISQLGYDGIEYSNEYEGPGTSWICFESNQVKSAIGNNGEFGSGKSITAAVLGSVIPATSEDIKTAIEWSDLAGSMAVAIADHDNMGADFAIHSGNLCVGLMKLDTMRAFDPKQYPDVSIDYMAVDPNFQRQGVGKKLVQFAIERARQAGVPLKTVAQVALGNPDTPADYWKSLGFVEKGRRTFVLPRKEVNKTSAITPQDRKLYRGVATFTPHDIKPNAHGIIWLAEEDAAYHYINNLQGTLFTVGIKPEANIVDLRDLSNPTVKEFKEAMSGKRKARVGYPISDEEWPEWADFGAIEAEAPWSVDLFKEAGIDGVIVGDHSWKGAHDSVALFNQDMVGEVTSDQTGTRGEKPKMASDMAGSIAVDEDGHPLLLWHGSNASFDTFKPNFHTGSFTAFFTEDKELARSYGDNLYAANLSIKNPAPDEVIIEAALEVGTPEDVIEGEYMGILLNINPDISKILKGKGYDGWVGMDSSSADVDMEEAMTYVVFSAAQIHKVEVGKTATAKTAKTIGPVYHGTTYDFDEFKKNKGLRSGFLGATQLVDTHAFFFTENKQQAIDYARNRQIHTKQPVRLITAYLEITNLLDFTNPDWYKQKINRPPLPFHYVPTSSKEQPEEIYQNYDESLARTGILSYLIDMTEQDESVSREEWEEMGIDYETATPIEGSFSSWQLFDNKAVSHALSYLGYDGFKVTEGHDPEFGGWSWAVRRTDQVRIVSNVKLGAKATSSDIMRWAKDWENFIFLPGEPGGVSAESLNWKEERNFDLHKIEGWGAGDFDWLYKEEKERTGEIEDNETRKRYFPEMCEAIKNHTIEEIFVVEGTDGQFYVWEGNHRVGIAHVLGVTTMPAFVGYQENSKTAAIPEEAFREYIAVDLDGTIAQSLDDYSDPTVIGEPIPEMIEKIQDVLEAGMDVIVFTARLADKEKAEAIKKAIADYTEEHIGVALDATNEKTPGMLEFWDDKAKGVEENTGKFAAGPVTITPDGMYGPYKITMKEQQNFEDEMWGDPVWDIQVKLDGELDAANIKQEDVLSICEEIPITSSKTAAIYADGSVDLPGNVLAYIEAKKGEYCQIYEWTSKDKGQGNTRKALQYLKQKYQAPITVMDAGDPEESPKILGYWIKMQAEGLVDELLDADHKVIAKTGSLDTDGQVSFFEPALDEHSSRPLVAPDPKTSAARGIYFHGSSTKNLRSIISQGLVPDAKKNYDTDVQSNSYTPSIESYGGIYVTQNLMTAIAAPRDHYDTGTELIVCMELQPNTFYADEDNIVSILNPAMGRLSDHAFSVGVTYVLAKFGGSTPWDESIAKQKAEYIDNALKTIQYRRDQNELGSMHPDLQTQLTKLLDAIWIKALGRLAAQHFNGTSRDSEIARVWRQAFGSDKPMPEASTVIPTVPEAEKEFSDQAEKFTRTLKSLTRPDEEGKQRSSWTHARLPEPVGYSGSNKIVAVIEVRAGDQFRGPDRKGPVPLIVHYGKIPAEFMEQWRQRMGSPTVVQEAKTAAPKLRLKPPAVVYHGTTHKFEEFRFKDDGPLGVHFGTLRQARFMATFDGEHSIENSSNYPRVISAHITLNNPIEMHDTGFYDAQVMIDFSPELKEAITMGKLTNTATVMDVKRYLQSAGYDGVTYRNTTAEGKGRSYIVFEPSQIQVLDPDCDPSVRKLKKTASALPTLDDMIEAEGGMDTFQDLKQLSRDELLARYAKLTDLFNSFTYPLKVYRALELQHGIEDLKRKTVGVSWTWDEDAAKVYDGVGEHSHWLIQGTVNRDSIDWNLTLALNISPSSEMEKEVRLHAGANIELIAHRSMGGEDMSPWIPFKKKTAIASVGMGTPKIAQHSERLHFAYQASSSGTPEANKVGYWFDGDPTKAEEKALEGANSTLLNCRIELLKPYVIEDRHGLPKYYNGLAREAKVAGYDGVIFKNAGNTAIVAFSESSVRVMGKNPIAPVTE